VSGASAGRRALLAAAPPLASGLIRLTWATARVSWTGREQAEPLLRSPEPFILAFGHCKLFLMQYALLGRPVTALISRHGDGELIARTMARFGHDAARGSSTRGGAQALREALRAAHAGRSLAITPDGPKGPARSVKPGVIEIARAAGIAILPCSLAARPARRLRSWDRFEVPWPFARVAVAYGPALRVERRASEGEREAAAARLGAELDALTDGCERAVGNAP
jgi:lysophospholipid acyltransferase (LPLAT)-like uncharacterized protein